MTDKDFAIRRLRQAIYYCTTFNTDFDQEERDHLREIMRIIENVPEECFDGFGDFKGPGR